MTLINSEHASEQPFEVKGEISLENNGTLEDLYRKIDELIG